MSCRESISLSCCAVVSVCSLLCRACALMFDASIQQMAALLSAGARFLESASRLALWPELSGGNRREKLKATQEVDRESKEKESIKV